MQRSSRRANDLIAALRSELGADKVSTARPEKIAYSSDMWPRHQIWKLMGEHARHTPDAVVWPESEDEVVTVVRACREHGIPIVPYGGGSGVCGGTIPVHGGIVVDTKRMGFVGLVDDIDLTVTADAGVIGMHLEQRLEDQGYTLGHFPSSILCSTVGGWLAARSAGQFSSRYGKIEDMVVSLRAVLPDGTILDTTEHTPVDWNQLIVGSEGTLGIVTRTTLRVAPAPRAEAYRGYRFRSLEAGLLGIRRLMQSGLQPHLVRLYDPFDSLLHSSGEGSSAGGVTASVLNPVKELLSTGRAAVKKRGGAKLGLALALSRPAVLNGAIDKLPVPCLLVLGFQGSQTGVDRDMEAARALLEQAGGTDGGEGPGRRWKAHRYDVSFKQAGMFAAGAFADTMEVSCTWSRLSGVYWAVRRTVSPHALVMAHFSHAYVEGCSIYFTFVGYRRDAAALDRLYEKMWEDALGAVLTAGGSISHHHGIGLAKRDHMRREHGAGIRLLYALKEGLDPDNLMNPGKLLPDRAILE